MKRRTKREAAQVAAKRLAAIPAPFPKIWIDADDSGRFYWIATDPRSDVEKIPREFFHGPFVTWADAEADAVRTARDYYGPKCVIERSFTPSGEMVH